MPRPPPDALPAAQPPWTPPAMGHPRHCASLTETNCRTFQDFTKKSGQFVQDARDGAGSTQRRASPDHPPTLCRRGRRSGGAPSPHASLTETNCQIFQDPPKKRGQFV